MVGLIRRLIRVDRVVHVRPRALGITIGLEALTRPRLRYDKLTSRLVKE